MPLTQSGFARIDTPLRTPPLSLVFGYGPVLVIFAAGVVALGGMGWAIEAGRIWSAAILIFLGGVVRGLSFFTHGGPRFSQMAVMLLRYLCGLAALAITGPGAFILLAAGYLSSLLYDPRAARTGGAPRFFASQRPPQMAIALVGLGLLYAAAQMAG